MEMVWALLLGYGLGDVGFGNRGLARVDVGLDGLFLAVRRAVFGYERLRERSFDALIDSKVASVV